MWFAQVHPERVINRPCKGVTHAKLQPSRSGFGTRAKRKHKNIILQGYRSFRAPCLPPPGGWEPGEQITIVSVSWKGPRANIILSSRKKWAQYKHNLNCFFLFGEGGVLTQLRQELMGIAPRRSLTRFRSCTDENPIPRNCWMDFEAEWCVKIPSGEWLFAPDGAKARATVSWWSVQRLRWPFDTYQLSAVLSPFLATGYFDAPNAVAAHRHGLSSWNPFGRIHSPRARY